MRRNLVERRGGRFLSLLAQERINFTARRSTISEMTCSMRMIGLQTTRPCPSRENARTTSEGHSVAPLSRVRPSFSFPTKGFDCDCRRLLSHSSRIPIPGIPIRGNLQRIGIPGIGIRDECESSLRQSQSKPFVGKEKEGLTLDNGATECPSEVVLAFSRLGQGRVVCKPIIRIEHVISEIVERRAVKLIRS